MMMLLLLLVLLLLLLRLLLLSKLSIIKVCSPDWTTRLQFSAED
jgi:hypothetical protein